VSHLIQSIVVTIALVAGATAHARTSTYEFVGDFYNQDFNWHVSSARVEIKVSSTDYGSPVKLERLEIYPFDPISGSPTCIVGYHRCLPRFVATGFRNLYPGSGSYQATIKNWSYFSYVHANVEVGSYSDASAYDIATGGDHTCALDDNGVTCWGNNANGQTTVPASLVFSGQDASGTTSKVEVAAGRFTGY
jgi:hypothetical protein